jgi:hypothetical protein
MASRVENRRSGVSFPVAIGDAAFAAPASIRFDPVFHYYYGYALYELNANLAKTG